MKQKILLGTVVVLAVVAALAGAKFRPTKTQISVRFNWHHQAQFAGFYVAQEKGWYSQAGLKVNLKERDFGQQSILEEVASGQAEFAVVQATELLKAVSEGKKVKAVAAIFQRSPTVLAAKIESGITKPSDFAGKTLGIVSDSYQSKMFFSNLLKLSGVPETQVTYKVVGSNQLESLLNKTVDVVAWYRTSESFQLEKRGESATYIFPEDFGMFVYGDVLVASESFIETYPDVTRAFVEQTLRGWNHALKNPSVAVEYSLKYAQGKYADAELQKYIVEKSRPLILTSNQGKVGDMDFWKWRKLYDLLNSVVQTQAFDVTNAYTLEFLK